LTSITAKDSHGNLATSYIGSHTLVLTSPSNGVDTGTPTASINCSFNSGFLVSCNTITLVKSETVKLTLTDGGATGESNDIVVDGGYPTHLHLNHPPSVSAGVQFNLTSIYAQDTYGNTSGFYSGTKTLNYG